MTRLTVFCQHVPYRFGIYQTFRHRGIKRRIAYAYARRAITPEEDAQWYYDPRGTPVIHDPF